jgi:hypothetical protein
MQQKLADQETLPRKQSSPSNAICRQKFILGYHMHDHHCLQNDTNDQGKESV